MVDVHAPIALVHPSTSVPVVNPVTVVVLTVGFEMLAVPETTDQEPVPIVIGLPETVVELVEAQRL